jgi:Flp pilus assembly pilin Flp
LKEEDGVSAIEYTLLAAVVAFSIFLAVDDVRQWIVDQLGQVDSIPGTPAA